MSEFMRFEPAEELRPAPARAATPGPLPMCGPARKEDVLIHHAVMPGGKRIALLKSLLTSACERDCYYCPFRAGRDFRRITFKPEEMAQTFVQLHRAGVAEGLFLSSGVAGGGMRTQDRLLDTAEILRRKMGYKGYLHLKIMPGAERAQVEQAMRLADRVSINLEAPNSKRLQALAPHKTFMDELLRPLQWVEEIRRSQPGGGGWNGRWPSTTTQFVVGGVGESDLELLSTTARLHQQMRIARAYFSGFNPVADTPLENVPAADPWREHRLYQASFLLRDYGFDLEELPFSGDGNLPLAADPKLAWARANLAHRPIEINRAEPADLLRVPGIGPKTAQSVVRARRANKIRTTGDLKALGIPIERAAPYLLLDGRALPSQLTLM